MLPRLTVGSGWEEKPGRQSAAEHRRKVCPAPCASQAPCASEGCRAHSAPENNLAHRALHRESPAGFSPSNPARKEDTTAEPSGQEPDRAKDLLPKGQMKDFSYLNSPSHHVPWCYETRLWLCNTKPHESIRPRLFHSPCWNSAAANNTGTGTTWLLFQLLWAYTNQMPNQPMDKIAHNVPSGIEAIVNKIQNVQRYFLQPELLVRGKRKGKRKKTTNHLKRTHWYLLLRIISVICMLCYHSISNVANKGRSSRKLTFKHISWAGPKLCFNKPWTFLQLPANSKSAAETAVIYSFCS